MGRLVVATYNVHCGVDGWGRPFDVVDACRRIDADVLALQEVWTPDGGVSMADTVGRALGYVVMEMPLARGRIVRPPPTAGGRWGPRLWSRTVYGLHLARRGTRVRRTTVARLGSESGSWGIAVLSRLPVVATRRIDLAPRPNDPARRGAIVVDLAVEGKHPDLRFTGTHMAHVRQGSFRHIGTLRRQLRVAPGPDATDAVGDGPPGALPGVLAGDMNLFGPPLSLLLPGWSRAVRGRTWPSWTWRPLAQSDHILVTTGVRAEGEVLRLTGSDHLPVRATLVI